MLGQTLGLDQGSLQGLVRCRQCQGRDLPGSLSSTPSPGCWKHFKVRSVIQASKAGVESPIALGLNENRTLPCGLGLDVPSNFSSCSTSFQGILHLHCLASPWSCDHNYECSTYLWLIMPNSRKTAITGTSAKHHIYTSIFLISFQFFNIYQTLPTKR